MTASVSLILPATDETYSLRQTVEQAKTALPGRALQFLIVTSPKMTTPGCRAVIAELEARYGDSIEAFDQTMPGIGGAIRDAFARAKHEYVVLMASDLETDPAVLPALIGGLDAGADIAATTRWAKGARFKGYDPLKLVFNFFFQLGFRTLYWTKLTDLTYAYRAYRAPVVKRIRWEETKFPFLFETIVKPLRLGYKVVEVQAPWRARTEGVSHNSFAATAAYFKTGLKIRFMKKEAMVY